MAKDKKNEAGFIFSEPGLYAYAVLFDLVTLVVGH